MLALFQLFCKIIDLDVVNIINNDNINALAS